MGYNTEHCSTEPDWTQSVRSIQMIEAESIPVEVRGESGPGTNEENEVVVLRLKKYGFGTKMVLWVSALGWYGLALSLLSILASSVLVMTPWVFQRFCGPDITCNIMTVATGVISAVFSLLWIFFSVKLLKKKQCWQTEEWKDLVKTGCFVVACFQLICGGYIFTSLLSSTSDLSLQHQASDIICSFGSLLFITFSCLLLYGILWKKPKPVHASFLFSLVLDSFLIVYFSMGINSSGLESILPIFGLVLTLIHLSYCNGLIILQYNIMLHDMGFYKKNLEFFNEAFRVEV